MQKHRWSPLIAAAVAVAVCVPLPNIAQAAYESRIGTSVGEGYPISSWMAMGMQEGAMACGWYNGYSQEMYRTYGTDIGAIKQRNAEDISERLHTFAEDPSYACRFYQDKFSSQWNESTFESLWVGGVCEPYAERGALYEAILQSGLPDKAMNYSTQLIYTGFLFSAVVMLKKRRTEQMIFPIVLLGGVLFHLLFEASSKYVLSYLPLFCPLAAYGILALGVDVKKWFVREGVR